jgi:hypothetical protein
MLDEQLVASPTESHDDRQNKTDFEHPDKVKKRGSDFDWLIVTEN